MAVDMGPEQAAEALRVKRAAAISRRYTDSYRVANAVIGAGTFLKVIGFLGALIDAGIAVMAASSPEYGRGLPFPRIPGEVYQTAIVTWGLISALVTWLIWWFFGVIVSSSGQTLKANLDCAVNSSPFLNDRDKAILQWIERP